MRPCFSRTVLCASVLASGLLMFGESSAAPQCYSGSSTFDPLKPNKLYVYFPTAADATFPDFNVTEPTISPVPRFDIADLPNPPAGTTATLRNRIFDSVASDYCEFNVQVLSTITNPDSLGSPPPRRNMVAVGADANGDATGVLFGIAENVDIGDGIAIDHARVWGGSYGVFCGAPGGALDGAGNTLERWAFAIGGTAAHEGGHNYGLSHSDGAVVRPGEDALTNHIMPAGGSVPCLARVSQRRHFNDTVYGILANNVGLTVQTLSNWDFVNPNSANASKLRLEVLSTAASLSTSWVWTGGTSPWDPPSVSGPSGTQVFKGVTYNRFFITWSTGKVWQSVNQPGSSPGVVRGAEQFHVGLNFTGVNFLTPDPVLVVDAVLLDGSNNPLSLHPRTPSYNSGTIAADGSLIFNVFNLSAQLVLLRNWQAFVLPRQVDISSMVSESIDKLDFRAADGQPFAPWRQVQLPTAVELPGGSVEKPGEAHLFIGNLLREGHNVRIVHGSNQGTPGDHTGDATGRPEVNPEVPGSLVTDPFPGASLLLVGDVVEPNATQWDPELKTFVTKDLTTRVFFQVAGQRVKPVIGQLTGLRGSKVVCTNLSSRRSIFLTPVAPPTGGPQSWDCEKSGLVSYHGDRIEVSQKGVVGDLVPAVQVAGMHVDKVVCTNLSTRQSVSFSMDSAGPIDCKKAGLEITGNQTLEITEKGTVR